MLSSHQIELKINNKQRTYFAKASGVARKAYNWGLSRWQEQYEAQKIDSSKAKPNQLSLRRELNAIKGKEFPWMLEVTKNAPQMALIHLGKAFENFFKGRSKYPRYKKKGRDDSFTLTNDQFTVDGCRIRIPKLGWVRMREALRYKGKIMTATVKRIAARWYVSITVDIAKDEFMTIKTENQGVVGVDLGISALAALSTGELILGPQALRSRLSSLQRLSRALSRKDKNSSNYKKARAKLANLHARISNIRKDALHKLSSYLVANFSTIVIEDLNVKGMMKNRCLARSIADMGFFELKRQLDYKAEWYGKNIIVADRWYPSSKRCSSCGHILDKLSLAKRTWQCPLCHTEHHRDINAALNLKSLAVSSTVSACGEVSSGLAHLRQVKLTSVKQEVNSNSNPR